MSVLYVSDLDGTLLRSDGTLSPRSRAGMLRLLERGVALTVATARSHFSIRSLLSDMPFVLPVIEFNGAFLTDYATGRHLRVNAIEEELSHQVLDVILKARLRPFISSFDGQRDLVHYDELINEAMRLYAYGRRIAGDTRLARVRQLEKSLAGAVVSLTVMTDAEGPIRALEAELSSRFGTELRVYCYENAYHRGTFWLTVHGPRANKHWAVKTLREHYADHPLVIAFGDHQNDLEMLRTADHGVAMENATPEVKQVADEIIGTSAEDSVVRYIMQREGLDFD